MTPPGRRLTWLDVFTATPMTGNGLAVVHDADGVDDVAMRAFARETRLAETTFVQTATAAGADYRNRIWTTFAELPFAGHPSLGTAVAVALAAGRTSTTYVQETGAGLQPIEVRWHDDDRRAAASMVQSGPQLLAVVDVDDAVTAVGLTPDDADPTMPAQVVSTGLATVVVPVAAAALDAVVADPSRIEALLATTGATTVYVVAVDRTTGRVRARCVFPAGEDPATGSAAGALGAYLADRVGLRSIVIHQGAHVGRPSELRVEVAGDEVRVSGDVVVLAVGEVWL